MPTIPHLKLTGVKNSYNNGGRIVFHSSAYSGDLYFEDIALFRDPLLDLGLTEPLPDSYDAVNRLAMLTDVDLALFNAVMDKYRKPEDIGD